MYIWKKYVTPQASYHDVKKNFTTTLVYIYWHKYNIKVIQSFILPTYSFVQLLASQINTICIQIHNIALLFQSSQGNVLLRHLIDAKPKFMFRSRSAFIQINNQEFLNPPLLHITHIMLHKKNIDIFSCWLEA